MNQINLYQGGPHDYFHSNSVVLMRSTLIRLSGRCRTVRAQLQCLSLVRLPMRVISTHSVNNIQLQTPQQLLCPAQQHVRTFAKTKKQNKSPESEEFDAEELKAKSRRNMNGAILNFTRQLSQMRPGKADGGIFDTVHVQAYGQSVPLPQLAQIAVTGAYSLSVNVYDQSVSHMADAKTLNDSIICRVATTGSQENHCKRKRMLFDQRGNLLAGSYIPQVSTTI